MFGFLSSASIAARTCQGQNEYLLDADGEPSEGGDGVNLGVLQFMSKALGHHVSYSVILPDASVVGPGPYPVLFQLHGASDDHAAWTNRSNLARHVSSLPLIVVMPDGALSFWINHNGRERFEDFLTMDLWDHVRATFQVREGKAAIGGLSMGGYGALHNGLKHPERYCSVWAHSSACFNKEDFLRWAASETPPQDLDDADLFELAKKVDPANMPVVTFDCGTEDFLLDENRRFHGHLESLGLPHTYMEHPGSHSWDYWDVHVKEALEQHARALGI